MAYDKYIAWRRLTHNGTRTRDQMSPADQAEWDSLGITTEDTIDPVEAKRAYEEATGRSRPSSVA